MNSRRMRVLFLADSLANGGAERQLALLLKNLPPEWEGHLWSLDAGPWARDLCDAGFLVEVHSRAWRWDITPAANLWSLMRHWNPDVVHSWGWMCSMAAGPMCAALRIPLVDGSIRSGRLPARRRLAQKVAMNWAIRVVANSRAGLNAWGIGPEKGRVVYNAFDQTRLEGLPPHHASKDGRFTVIMTGRTAPAKDYRTFFRAARLLTSQGNGSWRFVAVGDGPDRSALLAETKDLIDDGVVEFPEPRVEILDLVAVADVGVLMTDASLAAEGCSNSIVEYMACALPVVCSEGGGNRELVVDGETGFVVTPGDANHLAYRLLWLRNDPREGVRMGATGRVVVTLHLGVATMVSQMIALYDEARAAAHER